MEWWEFPALLLMGIGEFCLSWLGHRINWYNISSQRMKAARLDFFANTLGEIIPYFLYVISQHWYFILPRVIGNTLGTFYASGKKPRRPPAKKKVKNKYPKTITTA